jgi:hypothetical protein
VGATVEAVERSNASGADKPNREEVARGCNGETKPVDLSWGRLGAGAEEEETERRGKRSPAAGKEFEFGSCDFSTAGEGEGGTKEATVMDLAFGICLERENERSRENAVDRESRGEKRKPNRLIRRFVPVVSLS